MNITHAVDEEIKEDDMLDAIFNRQKKLMNKYHDIEERSGLLQTGDCPVNLDDKKGQARIKDFSWRVMEEVGEALDAKLMNDKEHYKEELIDGLHFLTELTILTGTNPRELPWSRVDSCDTLQLLFIQSAERSRDNINNLIAALVMDLGMMCNCLKNKPWKQTNMITDKENFLHKLKLVWFDYISILQSVMGVNEVVMTYLKKSQVNKFRQRSGY